jgi:hypothetical protein
VSPQDVRDRVVPGDRVFDTRPCERGEGVVQAVELPVHPEDPVLVAVRWDHPGLDDETIELDDLQLVV